MPTPQENNTSAFIGMHPIDSQDIGVHEDRRHPTGRLTYVFNCPIQDNPQELEVNRPAPKHLPQAICGFSNIGSIAIQIGGIGGIAPNRQSDLARMGVRAMIAGSIACFMTAAIAGMLL